MGGLRVAVLAGSRWAGLERFDTRWRRIATAWAEHPDVRELTVVDLPWFTSPLTPPSRLVRDAASWLPGSRLLQVKVPAGAQVRLDRLAWRRTAGALLRELAPEREPLLVVGTTPVSAPLLPLAAAAGARTAFDAVDVWRMRTVGGQPPTRIAAGYTAGAGAHRTSCVSPTLQAHLREVGADPLVVPNGVALSEFAALPRLDLPELPEGPFCAYVGTIGHRLDLSLMRQVWSRPDVPPLVLFGPPADDEHRRAATEGPWHWAGSLDADQIPAALARAAVAVLPQQDTALTEAQDYMKLFQYLASGAPVVSTPLLGMPEGVLVAEGADAFAAAVRTAAGQPRRTEPHPLVVDRDWDVLADRMLQHFAEGL